MVIKKVVYKARKQYKCDSCLSLIKQGEQYRYFYGAPDIGDKPYSLRICKDCDHDKKGYKQDEEN